jgi:hypothetical protein
VFLDSGKVWTQAASYTFTGGAGNTQTTDVATASNTTLTSIGTELQLLPSVTGWNARLQLAWAVGATRPSDDVSADDRKGLKPGEFVEHDRGPHIWLTIGKTF